MLARAVTTPLTAPMPTPPARNFSFTDWQTNNPTAPPPGDKLDSNFDLSNASIAQIITWANVSLNTDGTLRDGSVGQSTLVAGLFDGISQDVINDVQPLVDEAQSYATSAQTSANNATNSANGAANSATSAANASNNAASSAQAASTAQTGAQSAQTQAVNASTTAQNAANGAAGSEATCTDYGLVCQAWAEHMPDTIPPNILAVMGISGSHWSAAWYANQAQQTLSNAQSQIDQMLQNALDQINQATNDSIAKIQASVNQWYLGALPNDPVTAPTQVGCLYFNTSTGELMVWNGTVWQTAVGVSLGTVAEYQFKPPNGTTVLTGNDLHNNPFVVNPSTDTVSVWKGGTRIFSPADFSVQSNQITLVAPADGNTTYTVDVTSPSATIPALLTVKLNVANWVPDGAAVTFPLLNSSNTPVVPKVVSDILFSEDGVWLEAGKDFTVAGSNITFAAAPQPDANLFGVMGIPVGAGP